MKQKLNVRSGLVNGRVSYSLSDSFILRYMKIMVSALLGVKSLTKNPKAALKQLKDAFTRVTDDTGDNPLKIEAQLRAGDNIGEILTAVGEDERWPASMLKAVVKMIETAEVDFELETQATVIAQLGVNITALLEKLLAEIERDSKSHLKESINQFKEQLLRKDG